MKNIVMILNDSPYGSERLYNSLRIAHALLDQDQQAVRLKVFLMSDSVYGALQSQQTPELSYNIQQMLEILLAQDVPVVLCKTCVSARGISLSGLISDVEVGTLDTLTDWTLNADQVLTM